MARQLGNLWAAFVFSTLVSIASGVAILGFGAPPKMLVPITYATAAIIAGVNEWANRHLGRY
jgi:hypothetical protein